MAWFDGTFDWDKEEFEKEFPVQVTPNLRQSSNGKRIAVISDFEKGSAFYDLSDPKAEKDYRGEHIFYYPFLGQHSPAAKQVLESFLSEGKEKDSESILLFRKEPDRFFLYSYGHICTELLKKQNELVALLSESDIAGQSIYVLPLKRYMHRCPVCGCRTLQYRGYFEICRECGWEDEGIDNENEEPLLAPNGDYTIKEYREKYLKLKAEAPDYTWFK